MHSSNRCPAERMLQRSGEPNLKLRAITSECCADNSRNAARHHLGTPRAIKSEHRARSPRNPQTYAQPSRKLETMWRQRLRGRPLSPSQDRLALASKRWFSGRKLERAKGFEPSTPTLARLCSTPELRPLWRLETGGSQRVRRAISIGFRSRQALFAIFCEGLAYRAQIPHKRTSAQKGAPPPWPLSV